jgi:hypothetical protein
LGLCIDITLAYCKLLEVYNRSFRALAEVRGQDPLGLFHAFRSWFLAREGLESFYGLHDNTIWDGFRDYFDTQPEAVGDASLQAVLTFDQLLHGIATAPPLDADPPARRGTRFRLRPAARLITTPRSVITELSPGEEDAPGRYVVFATRDRIHTLELPELLYEALETLEELAELHDDSAANIGLYDTLRCAVAPLERFQLFEDLQ